MPRTCTVCSHPERAAIDRQLVRADRDSYRDIAGRFHLARASLYRHRCEHLPTILAKAREAEDVEQAIDVMAELRRCFERVNLLFDACDRWLRDPQDPTRYDIGPRSDDVDIIYSDDGSDGRQVSRKAPMAQLLARLGASGVRMERWETKHADPRELLLKTARQLQGQIELAGKLHEMADMERRLAELEQAQQRSDTWHS